jgi:hypothetical protein
MPKDEFDFDDPLELQGVGLFTSEDTTEVMAECFIEEFLRMGFDHHQILNLFKNPYYIGMNMVLQNRGEEFVRNFIQDTFEKWGNKISWAPVENHESPSNPRRTK